MTDAADDARAAVTRVLDDHGNTLCERCGADRLVWRHCKLVCEHCHAIVKSCADL